MLFRSHVHWIGGVNPALLPELAFRHRPCPFGLNPPPPNIPLDGRIRPIHRSTNPRFTGFPQQASRSGHAPTLLPDTCTPARCWKPPCRVGFHAARTAGTNPPPRCSRQQTRDAREWHARLPSRRIAGRHDPALRLQLLLTAKSRGDPRLLKSFQLVNAKP